MERKGYSRRADIPEGLLAALERGEEETRTLSEWLAVSPLRLLLAILPALGYANREEEFSAAFAAKGARKAMEMHAAVVEILFAIAGERRERERVQARLAEHPSDVAREWAARFISLEPSYSLAERLRLTRPFAADHSMNVREIAWWAVRPHLAAELPEGLLLLEEYALDRDPSIRRFAIEMTRPRGVWCKQIPALIREPAQAEPLLQRVSGDPSRYVQNSVGNWLNDASKSRPDWVKDLTSRWLLGDPSKETRYIVDRGLRTLRILEQKGGKKG